MIAPGSNVQNFDLHVDYDSAVLTAVAVSSTALTAGCSINANLSTPGHLSATGSCPAPMTGGGALFDVSATAVGGCGSSTTLSFATCILNQGAVACQTVSGQLTVGCMVTGHIRYYSNAMPVDAATVRLEGPTPAAAQTDGSGQFMFTGIGSGTWQIEPQKMGDAGSAVSSFDAQYALQAAVGLRALSPEQQLACDVSGNGSVSSFDAQLILQYAVGLIGGFPVAQMCASDWAFMPDPASANEQVAQPQVAPGSCQSGAITFQSPMTSMHNQDFAGVLFGDCTGNWQPGSVGALYNVATLGASRVRIGRARTGARTHRVRVPLYVQAGSAFQSMDVQLRYDASRLTPMSVHRLRNARHALLAANPREPGVLSIALASSESIRSGALLVVEFATQRHGANAAVRVARARLSEN